MYRSQTEQPVGPPPPLNKVVQRIEEQTAQAQAAQSTSSGEPTPTTPRPELKS